MASVEKEKLVKSYEQHGICEGPVKRPDCIHTEKKKAQEAKAKKRAWLPAMAPDENGKEFTMIKNMVTNTCKGGFAKDSIAKAIEYAKDLKEEKEEQQALKIGQPAAILAKANKAH